MSKCESRQIFLLFAMESRERSLQREAEAAIAALKHATIIRSTKADWQLVAAAQATRRGDYSDEFAAAAAMGKPITQRREVANWVDKLSQLEQRPSQSRRSVRLLVKREWVEAQLPGVQLLEPPSPVPSLGGQHTIGGPRGSPDTAGSPVGHHSGDLVARVEFESIAHKSSPPPLHRVPRPALASSAAESHSATRPTSSTS